MSAPTLQQPPRWLWLLFLIPVLAGLARLRFDTEVLDLLPSDLPVVEGLKIYQQYFSNAREVILTVEAPDAETAEVAARTIAEALRPLTNLVASAMWEPPGSEHPEQAAELIAYLWFNQPPAVFGQLTNRLAPANAAKTLNAAREQLAVSFSPEETARLSYDPFGLLKLPESVAGAGPSFSGGQEGFSSADGTFRILFVEARQDLRSYRECDDWLTAIRRVVDSAVAGLSQNGAAVQVGYTGRPAFVDEVASGMRHDVLYSIGGTVGVIALLFWIAHRRVKPMLWLVALLAATLLCTLAFGGLIFGRINVVSIGFAAILLGLAVDYAVVHYQEALAEPKLTIPQIRHAIAPSIFWAAVTTICAFLVLNLGGLPGLGQLGTLVGLGVALSAVIMIFEYLPPLFPERNVAASTSPARERTSQHSIAPVSRRRATTVLALTAMIVLCAGGLLLLAGAPPVDSTANALRPRKSPAYLALDRIQARLSQKNELFWVIIGAQASEEMPKRLDRVQDVLKQAESDGLISGFTLPAALWPRPEFQAENRALAAQLASRIGDLKAVALSNGFTEVSLGLTTRVLEAWREASARNAVYRPENSLTRWIFNKVIASAPGRSFALGMAYPAQGQRARAEALGVLQLRLTPEHVWLTDWALLGQAIFQRVKANMWKVVAPMVALVLLSLWLAFHGGREVLLSLIVLALSGLVLLIVMRIAGWSWNLLNLMAVPLILGTGVDYGIFIQLALRRHGGDLAAAHRAVGRALLLCGGTATAAFLMLGFSSNAGMASLGEICAVGIGSNMLIATYLLPVWWVRFAGRKGAR